MKTSESKLSLEDLAEPFGYQLKRRPLRPREAGALLGLSIKSLEDQRQNGSGPRYFKHEGSKFVYYAERDLLEWLAAGARRHTSEPVAA